MARRDVLRRRGPVGRYRGRSRDRAWLWLVVGHLGLIAPTLDITHTGQEEVLDGVRMIFQVTPGTEAPSEMNFLFPDQRALCMAENATHNLHNLLTLRGAEVRDARNWSRYIAEAIEMFARRNRCRLRVPSLAG